MKKFLPSSVFLRSLVIASFISLAVITPARAVTLNWGFKVPVPWIQTQGGGVHAVGSFVPDPLAIPMPTPVLGGYFSLDQPAGNPGIVSCGAGCTSFGGGLASSRGWKVAGASFDIQAYNFGLYNTRLNQNSVCNFAPASKLNNEFITATGNVSATVHCFYPQSGDTITVDQDINIPSGMSRVVLIKGRTATTLGNLLVSKPVSVAQSGGGSPGGFLAFIVSGDIRIAAGVGSTPPDNTPDVAGVYIASGKLLVNSSGNPVTEKEFIGRGTFVGYQGVEVKRNLGELNASYPAAFFIYDTELARRIDSKLTRSQILWQQVPP